MGSPGQVSERENVLLMEGCLVRTHTHNTQHTLSVSHPLEIGAIMQKPNPGRIKLTIASGSFYDFFVINLH